ncbi:GNAT family N-acetyltransferase [Elioraea sp.]|uniref:GNAT family N-acetyltransferase n=1 Tax=Elioraea sp. TaxID=2185103 RepID=UPI0025C662B3|nr:GNAT family protein [Elioraea sp.]
MRVRLAEEDDIAFVMAVERTPGYARVIGQWPEARHRAVQADPAWAVLIGEREEQRRGFAILRGRDTRRPAIQRIAVAEAGQGEGRDLLAAVIDHAFGAFGLATLSLEVFAHNTRARRAYARAGFAPVGFVPEAWRLADGTVVDDVLMRLSAVPPAR